MRISDWSSDVCSSDLLQLGEADNEPSPRNRIFIDEEGKVRPSIKPSKPSPVAEKRSKRRSSDPDYGELTEKSLKEEDESEDSERSEEHTSELQSLMRISYAVFCLKTEKHNTKVY